LDSVIKKHQLTVNEQLCCIKTIFVILSGQGSVINIDPVHFYSHLYKVIPELDCCKLKTILQNLLGQFKKYCFCFLGKHHENLETFLLTIEALFLIGRKKVTANSSLAFVKRMATLTLQTLHNSSLGILAALRTNIQVISSIYSWYVRLLVSAILDNLHHILKTRIIDTEHTQCTEFTVICNPVLLMLCMLINIVCMVQTHSS